MPTSQLRRTESRLLAVERPNALGHTSMLTVLDAARASRPLNGALLHAEVAARLDEIPVLRQSLVDVPLGLDRSWWRDDPSFDLDYHLRYIAVPDGGEEDPLRELVARIHSRPLDRRRPLWELYLITGLQGGRAALLSKLHLAAIGAAGGHELTAGLVGPSPDLRGEEVPPGLRWRPQPGPTWIDISSRAWLNAALDPWRTLGMLPRRLNRLPGFRRVLNPTLALLNQRTQQSIAVSPGLTITPRTSINGRVGPHRRFASTELDLERIAAIRRTAQVSTVDVVTALCSGALRHWLVLHDELPLESLKALVPLSVTDPDAVDGLAGVVISLETQQHDPLHRLATIHDEIGEAVVRHDARSAEEIRGVGGGTPLVGMVASRLLERSPLADRLQPLFNTVITSVPGPDEPQFALGAPVEAIHPVLGVVDGVGLHIGTMSVVGRLCLSLTADRDLVPDLSMLAARIPEELAILERELGL